MQASDPILTVVQYGWPGVIALIMYWGGKIATRLVEAHLDTMKAMVEKLGDIHVTTTETNTKLDSVLARARETQPSIHD